MEIHLRPEQEAFIEGRVRAGRFASAEEALREAVGLLQQAERLQSEDVPRAALGSQKQALTGRDLIAVMQACPYPEVDLEPVRIIMPVHEPAF